MTFDIWKLISRHPWFHSSYVEAFYISMIFFCVYASVCVSAKCNTFITIIYDFIVCNWVVVIICCLRGIINVYKTERVSEIVNLHPLVVGFLTHITTLTSYEKVITNEYLHSYLTHIRRYFINQIKFSSKTGPGLIAMPLINALGCRSGVGHPKVSSSS